LGLLPQQWTRFANDYFDCAAVAGADLGTAV
jgi:hypothetical protein